jgi:hypothetical protein
LGEGFQLPAQGLPLFSVRLQPLSQFPAGFLGFGCRLFFLSQKPVGFLQLSLGAFVFLQLGEALAELLVLRRVIVKPG